MSHRHTHDPLGVAMVGSALLALAIQPAGLEAQRRTTGTQPVVRVAAAPSLASVTCENRTTACPSMLLLMPGERVGNIYLHGTGLDALDRASALGVRDGANVEVTFGDMVGSGSRRISLEAVPGRVPVGGVTLRLQAGQASVEPDLQILIPGVDHTNREALFGLPFSTVLRAARVRFGSCGPLSNEWKVRVEIPNAGYASAVDIPRVVGALTDPCVEERDAMGGFVLVDVTQGGERALATLEWDFRTIDMRAGAADLTYQFRSVRFISRLPVEVSNGTVRIGPVQSDWRAGGGEWMGNRIARAGAPSGPTDWMRERMDQITGQIQLALNGARGSLRDEIVRSLRSRGVQQVLALDEGTSGEWAVIFRE